MPTILSAMGKSTSDNMKMHIQDFPNELQNHILNFVPKGEVPYLAQTNKIMYKRISQLLQSNKPLHNINNSSDVFIKKFHETIKIVKAKYPLITNKKTYIQHHHYICEQFKKYENTESDESEDNNNMAEWAKHFLHPSQKDIDALYCYMNNLCRYNDPKETDSMAVFTLLCEYIEVTLLYLSINRVSKDNISIIELLTTLYYTKCELLSFTNKSWFAKHKKLINISNYIAVEFHRLNIISSKILDLELNHDVNDVIRIINIISLFHDSMGIYHGHVYIGSVSDNELEEKYFKPLSKMEYDSNVQLATQFVIIYLLHLHNAKLELHPEYKKNTQTQINAALIESVKTVFENNNSENNSENTMRTLFRLSDGKITKEQIARYILNNVGNAEICKACINYLKQKNELLNEKSRLTFL